MKKNCLEKRTKWVLFLFLIFTSVQIFAQFSSQIKSKSDFWNHVQFGGGLGLGIGSGYTDVSIAPSAIYNINKYFSAGISLQYSYLKQQDLYDTNTYGGSIIALANPIPEVQLSVELEELRVNYNSNFYNAAQNFWNTGLFLGAGYRMENVTVGGRYNVLYNKDNGVYADAFMPFVRVYF